MTDSIDIPIKFPADTRGVTQSRQELERLLKAQQQVDKATVQNARAQSQLAAEESKQARAAASAAQANQKNATEQQRTATQAQRLATETARTTKEMNASAAAAQRQQQELAKTAAAQDRAATAALRRAQAEAKAAQQGQNGGLGPALPRTFAGITDEVKGQIAGALGPAAIVSGVAAAAAVLVDATKEAIALGSQVTKVTSSFNELARQSGTTGDALLGALRTGAAGEIDDLNLKLIANRANLLGVADSADEFSKLFQIARARSVALGTSTSEAFNDLVTGLGRGSPLILDNLGIMVKLGEANDQYAASLGKTAAQLTENEKKQALINAVLKTADDIPPPPTDAYVALGVAWENIRQSAAAAVSEGLRPAAEELTRIFSTGAQFQGQQEQIFAAAGSYDEYTEAVKRANEQIGAGNDPLLRAISGANALTEAQFAYAKSLIDGGAAAQEAVAKAQELATALSTVQGVQNALREDGKLTEAEIVSIGERMGDLAAQGGSTEATVIALGKSFQMGRADADDLTNGLSQLEQQAGAGSTAYDIYAGQAGAAAARQEELAASTQQVSAQSAIAQAETQLLAAKQQELYNAAVAAAQGSGSVEGAAAALARQFPITAAEAQILINKLRELAAIGGVGDAAAGLAEQRAGERGGGVSNAEVARQNAARRSAQAIAELRRQEDAREAAEARAGARGGRAAASAANKEAREAERAADQAQSIRDRQDDYARDLQEKQEAREVKHTEALVELEQDRAEKLVDIEQDAAEKLTDIQQDLADKQADIQQDATKKLTDIKKKEAADLAALAAKQAADDESARRGLANSVASAGIESRLSSSSDDFELAGSTGDERKALLEREARQKQQQEALQAAAARAQGMDPQVGQAAFEAERRGLEERAKLDEDYAARKEELEGDAAGLAELEALYAQRQAIIQEAVAQEIAEAQQEADLKRQAAEAEKAEVIQRAKDERKAVEEERKAQTAAVLRESEAQKAKVIADSEEQKAKVLADTEEQRTKIEEEYAKSGLAITKWADDAERDLQRVIDKADAATRALLDVGRAQPSGGAGAAQAPEARASGGNVAADGSYIVGEEGPERFYPNVDGYVMAHDKMMAAMGGGNRSLSVDLGGINVVQQPGQDAVALANMVAGLAMQKITQAMKGHGW